MPRIFLPPENFQEKTVRIEGEYFHHLGEVLRLKKGDPLWITDGSGQEFWVKIIQAESKTMTGEILGVRKLEAASLTEIVLYQGILKSNQMELVIQKTTEAGVSRLVPLITERTQFREISEHKGNRWEKIARLACAQSCRPLCPQIEKATPFAEALERASSAGTCWLLWENEEEVDPITAFLQTPPAKQLSIFIGPEGGFTQDEVIKAREKGGKILSLGKYIFRAETAAIVAVSLAGLLLEKKARYRPGAKIPSQLWKFM